MQALSDRLYYSYIVLRGVRDVVPFSDQIVIWSRRDSLESSPCRFVLGLQIAFSIDQLHLSVDERLDLIFHALPNITYLDLGDGAANSTTLASLAICKPRLRSIIGLGLSPSNYTAALLLLFACAETLQYLALVDTENMSPIWSRPAVLKSTVTLPLLRSLRLEKSHTATESATRHVVDTKWSLPRLEYLITGLYHGSLGRDFQAAVLPRPGGPTHGSTLVGLTGHWAAIRTGTVLEKIRRDMPKLETLVVPARYGGAVSLYGTFGANPRIKTVVVVHEDSQESFPLGGDPISARLERFLSLSTFPNLKRVLWVTSQPEDPHPRL